MSTDHAIEVYTEDLPQSVCRDLAKSNLLAVDLETTGLDFRSCDICLVQLYDESSDRTVAVRTTSAHRPENLCDLLDVGELVFHHAMFDLRFLRHHWNCAPKRVSCTKIVAKLLREKSSLRDLLEHHFGIVLDKTEQTSDWSATSLSAKQLDYARRDVVHLPRLLRRLHEHASARNLMRLVEACYEQISTRVELDVDGLGDVFCY